MLEHVRFRNFKTLVDVQVDLSRLTVIVGPNASGKTSVLRGLYELLQLGVPFHGEEREAFHRLARWGHELEELLRLRTHGRMENLEIDVREGDARQPSRLLALSAGVRPHDSITVAGVRYKPENGQYLDLQLSVPGGSGDARALFRGLSAHPLATAYFFHFGGPSSARPSYRDTLAPEMDLDGGGLPSVLSHIANTDRARLDDIESGIRSVIPSVGQLRTPPTTVRRQEIVTDASGTVRSVTRDVKGNALEVEVRPHGFIPADLVSEGTLRVIVIMTALHHRRTSTPRIVLLDDIDAGLHPTAQGALVTALRRILDVDPALQIVCTTHSPYVLDAFDESEVRVMTLDANAQSVCKPLSAHPDWPRWRKTMHLGEFWTSVGEGWVASPEAARAVGAPADASGNT